MEQPTLSLYPSLKELLLTVTSLMTRLIALKGLGFDSSYIIYRYRFIHAGVMVCLY